MKTIIDAHLDLAWNALGFDRDLRLELPEINAAEKELRDHPARGNATTCLPEMRRGNVAVSLVTFLARERPFQWDGGRGSSRMSLDHGPTAHAYAAGRAQHAYYEALAAEFELRVLRTVEDLDAHWAAWHADEDAREREPLGVIYTMEGADPILSPEDARAWWDLGLRSVNLVHYGRNRYAVGTGEDGPVSPLGRELLAAFEELGMILDVTHLSDTSFFEALDAFGGPVLASHNNCRALVPGGRQFSDEQLRLLLERGAVIGAVLDAWMLHPGWERGKTQRDVVDLAAIADHVVHICELAGNCDHVGIGSDLDGGFGTEQVPAGLDSIAELQKLDGILAARGFSDGDIEKFFHGNWLAFLRRHMPHRRHEDAAS